LAAELRPDPLGELLRFPRPSSRNEAYFKERGKGPTSKGDRREDREGTEREGGIPIQSKVSRINTG